MISTAVVYVSSTAFTSGLGTQMCNGSLPHKLECLYQYRQLIDTSLLLDCCQHHSYLIHYWSQQPTAVTVVASHHESRPTSSNKSLVPRWSCSIHLHFVWRQTRARNITFQFRPYFSCRQTAVHAKLSSIIMVYHDAWRLSDEDTMIVVFRRWWDRRARLKSIM